MQKKIPKEKKIISKKQKQYTPKQAIKEIQRIKEDVVEKIAAIEAERDRKLARLATKIDKRKIRQIEASLKNQK